MVKHNKLTIVLAFAIFAIAILAITGVIPLSAVNYQRNADTLITTGTMNLGTPLDLYLSPDEMTDIPVSGNVFANASGYLHVVASPNEKYCSYRMQKETGYLTPWEVYYASELTNDIKYGVNITQTDGKVISKTDLSPHDLSNIKIPLNSNPSRPNAPVYVQLNGQEASLGEGSCDDRQNFAVLRWGSTTVAVKATDYKDIVRGANPLAYLDLWNLFNTPNSQYRYDKTLDVSQIKDGTGLTTKYYEPKLGDANIEVSASFWAYKTIIFEKAPDGRARVDSCSIVKAETGQQTYASLVYTNIGETSKFFYTLTSSGYTTSGGSNSGSRVESGSQKQEILAVSASKVGSQTVNIAIRGESGIETNAVCSGEVVASGSGITPPVIPANDTIEIPTCYPFVQKLQEKWTGGAGELTGVVGSVVSYGGVGATLGYECAWDAVPVAVSVIAFIAILFAIVMIINGRRKK